MGNPEVLVNSDGDMDIQFYRMMIYTHISNIRKHTRAGTHTHLELRERKRG